MNHIRGPAPGRWVPLLLVAAAIGVMLFGVACRRDREVETAAPGELNVLLITVDTTRADRLRCYGYTEIDTPNIDRLADEGVQFSQCTSPAPITLPAHTSIMTGLYPFATGVRVNDANFVDENLVTLAEILRERGYRTAAFVAAAVLDRAFQLDQGFDEYVAAADPLPWKTPTPPLSAPPTEWSDAQRRGDEIADLAIHWLQHHDARQRFFLWAHFFDPHDPYDAPGPYGSKHRDPYLGEIEFMDHHIGRVLDELDRLKLAERTLVVLAADHGEGCGEHGEQTHAWFLYDSTLSVPLLFRLPGRLGPKQLVDAPVRLVDIMPTVLELLGCEIPGTINGVSLVPLMDGRTDDVQLEAYAESLNAYAVFNYARLRALRADGWKYVLAPRPELYDLARDPGELHNVIDAHPERAAEFRERIRDLIADTPVVAAPSDLSDPVLTAEQRGRLAALGYVVGPTADLGSGDDELHRFEPQGADPKDRVDVISAWSVALGMIGGNKVQAESILSGLAEREPDVATVHLWLGRLRMDLGKLEEADASFRRALAQAPESVQVHRCLSEVNRLLGRPELALEHARMATELQPNDPHAALQYGLLLAEAGRHQDAVAVFERCDEVSDHSAAIVKYRLAESLTALGQQSQAEAALRDALRLNPDHARANVSLGNLLAGRGEYADAVGYYRRAVAADPNFAPAPLRLGVALAGLGHQEEAVQALRQALRIDPALEEASARLGQVLLMIGRRAEAAGVLADGLQHHPNNVSFAVNLAALLVFSPEDNLRDGRRAVGIVQSAIATAGRETPELLNLLAAAQAEAGQFADATATAQKAAALAEAQSKTDLLNQIRERLTRYEQGRPAR